MSDNIVISKDLNEAVEYVPASKSYRTWIRVFSSDIGSSPINRFNQLKRRKKDGNKSSRVS